MTIYCVGRNFVKHAHELGNEVPTTPLIFLKADSSLRGFDESPVAFENETFHFEAELVLTIGRDFSLTDKVKLEDIESISLGIDLTRRENQSELKAKGLPWTTSKSFAGAAILGKKYDFQEFKNQGLNFSLWVNGVEKQIGRTENMIFSFLDICNYLNTFSPLKKGDLIYTGTPEGVGEIRKGDKFEMQLNEETKEMGRL